MVQIASSSHLLVCCYLNSSLSKYVAKCFKNTSSDLQYFSRSEKTPMQIKEKKLVLRNYEKVSTWNKNLQSFSIPTIDFKIII